MEERKVCGQEPSHQGVLHGVGAGADSESGRVTRLREQVRIMQ